MNDASSNTVTEAQIDNLIEELPDTIISAALQELKEWRVNFKCAVVPAAAVLASSNIQLLQPLGMVTYGGKTQEVVPIAMHTLEGEQKKLILALTFTDVDESVAPVDKTTTIISLDGLLFALDKAGA